MWGLQAGNKYKITRMAEDIKPKYVLEDYMTSNIKKPDILDLKGMK